MAWTKDTAGVKKDWLVATETITLDTSASDQSSSVINFIPYGKDWHLVASKSATLAATAPMDIDGCDSSTGTFWELATTSGVVLSTAATNDSGIVNNSAVGQAPYYKIRLDKTNVLKTTTGETVTFKVLVPPGNGIVY